MKLLFRTILITGLFIGSYSGFAQTDSVYSFTLNEAIEYGLNHNLNIKNAELDIKIANKKVWETTAIGLPQANAEGNIRYDLTISDFTANLGGFFGADSTGASSFNEDDLRLNPTVDITVTQIIFSGPYLIGLQASRVYKELSNLSHESTISEVKESITNAYFLELITKQNKENLDTIHKNALLTYNEMNAMFRQGFVDETSTDQLKITLHTIENSKKYLDRQTKMIKKLLKYQLGIKFEDEIVLTDNLETLLNDSKVTEILANNFNIENNTSYKLLTTQERLAKLNLRRRQSEFLPTIAGFYTHHENLNDDAFDFQSPDIIGAQISIPIFSSGQRLSVVSQAKLEYIKQQNINQLAFDGLKLEFEQTKSDLLNAYDNYITEKENMELSKRIYDNTLIKYKNGMSSSFDLTQAQSQYLESQSNYFQSIIDLTNNKLKLERLLNIL